MFDPIIQLNHHIALLNLKEMAVEEMGKFKGMTRSFVKIMGQLIMQELQKSKESMRANKMWIAEQPLPDGRYRYSFMGRAGTHEVTDETLEHYKRMALKAIDDRIKKI